MTSSAPAAGQNGPLTTGEVTPTAAGVRELARAGHGVIPVARRLLADGETPLGVYRKLAGGRGSFLLESAEEGAAWSRWSFVGVRSQATLTVVDGAVRWEGTPPPGAPTTGEPLRVLAETWRRLRGPQLPGLPPLTGGLVGYLGYDVVRRLEKLPSLAADDLALPELAMLVVTDLAALDHLDGSIVLIANVLLAPDSDDATIEAAYGDALERLDAMTAELAKPAEPTVSTVGATGHPSFRSRTPGGAYQPAVARALEHVRAGDVFQVQIGQRFEVETDVDALSVYRVLRTTNPSPYMYLLRLDDGRGGALDVVGSSPEAIVTVSGGTARLNPIAGTRPRGATPEADAALARELVNDPKEQAEHVMLVDLGRNDLGRVCTPGSVAVESFGVVERYSHVWHIVSTLVGEVAAGRDALDVLLACFPAGTVTGAPKVRAMEIIDALEPVRRGIYGGAVGYLDAAGDLDMALAIRTALLTGGRAYVQASAGIVADSRPELEEAETRHKATAALRALATATTMRPAR